jgi:lipid A 3-O-deacylase
LRAATAEENPEAVEMFSLKIDSISVYTENDKYFAGTDRHYTNGFKISALSTNLRSFKDPDVPGLLRSIADQVDNLIEPEREPKLGLSLGQNIYTPADIENPDYQPDDRPYAAWLYVGAAFHNYRPAYQRDDGTVGPARVDVFEINLGMVGPAALGEQVQNAVHNLLDIPTAQGWDNQINNEPGLNLIYEAKWRFSTAHARDSWGLDFIPHAGVCLGNVFTYANVGAEMRFGFRMPNDFGTSLIRPTGDTNSGRRARFSFFVFVGTDGRAVARDITLDGNTWSESPSIEKESFVYDVIGGIGCGFTHWQLTYTQARRSPEFKGQPDPQDFGSLSASYFF